MVETAIAGAYDLAGLGDVGLDNSLARSKVLIGAAGAVAQLLEAEREESWSGWPVRTSVVDLGCTVARVGAVQDGGRDVCVPGSQVGWPRDHRPGGCRGW